MGNNIWEILHGFKPVMLMVIVQIAAVGMNIFYVLAANDGMDSKVLVAYRWIFAAFFTVPLAFIFEWRRRPKLSWVVLFQAFLSGLFGGSMAQNLYLESLALTSATFLTAMSNIAPAITLILATLFRLESLELKTAAGTAKVVGILIGIGGAMFLTFYKGAVINIWKTNIHLLQHRQHQSSRITGSHILGSFFALASCISYALWLIVQTKMSKRFPYHYSSTALMSVTASIQSVLFCLCTERNWSHWKLGWNIRLLTAAYSGIVTSGMVVTLIAWCVHIRGPVFVSCFGPLSLVLIAIVGSLVLDEKLHVGSIIGGVVIVCGLYMVLWGKSKELKEKVQLVPLPTTNSTTFDLPDINSTQH